MNNGNGWKYEFMKWIFWTCKDNEVCHNGSKGRSFFEHERLHNINIYIALNNSTKRQIQIFLSKSVNGTDNLTIRFKKYQLISLLPDVKSASLIRTTCIKRGIQNIKIGAAFTKNRVKSEENSLKQFKKWPNK